MLCPRVNVGCGPAEERVLLTGLHAVADIYCENCKTTLGWKYVSILGAQKCRFSSVTICFPPAFVCVAFGKKNQLYCSFVFFFFIKNLHLVLVR